jgi:hypothetical protein
MRFNYSKNLRYKLPAPKSIADIAKDETWTKIPMKGVEINQIELKPRRTGRMIRPLSPTVIDKLEMLRSQLQADFSKEIRSKTPLSVGPGSTYLPYTPAVV